MVVQKTIDNLKERPQDERKVVAGGIAIALVVILLIGWTVLFFKRISNGSQQGNFESGAQEEFNFTSVKEAQQQIEQLQGYTAEELSRIRDEAAARQLQGELQQPAKPDDGSDAFQPPQSSY